MNQALESSKEELPIQSDAESVQPLPGQSDEPGIVAEAAHSVVSEVSAQGTQEIEFDANACNLQALEAEATNAASTDSESATAKLIDARADAAEPMDSEQPRALAEPTESQPAQPEAAQASVEVLSEEEKANLRKKGTDLFLGGRIRKAIEFLEKGQTEDDWEAKFCLGMAYIRDEQFDKAQALLQNIAEGCTDRKILERARQAANNLNMDLHAPAPESTGAPTPSGSATPKQQTGIPSPLDAKVSNLKTVAAQKLTKEYRSGPICAVILVLTLLGASYAGGVYALPYIYRSLVTPESKDSAVSVQSLGTLNNIEPHLVTIPGAHGSKLVGAVYEQAHPSEILLIHPGAPNEMPLIKSLAETALGAGLSVMVYDPLGRGASKGNTSWNSSIDDGLFAYDHLHGVLGYPAEKIIHYGNGFASATAAKAAIERVSGGLIMENPFCSMFEMTTAKAPLLRIFPASLCPAPDLNLIELMKSHPRLLIVQSQGSNVPASQTQAFIRRVSAPRTVDTQKVNCNEPHWTGVLEFLQTAKTQP